MAEHARPESRLPPLLVIAALVALIVSMPSHYALVTSRVLPYILGAGLAVPLIVAGLAPAGSVWAKVERWGVGLFVGVGIVMELIIVQRMTGDIVFHRLGLSALTLLSTSIMVWMSNLLFFTLIYWQVDRGGPDGRARGWDGRADFTFAQGNPNDHVPADWRPSFTDYLFLGFNTSTDFSPSDTSPLTARAKLLMMAQSLISLITLVIVAARAINIMK